MRAELRNQFGNVDVLWRKHEEMLDASDSFYTDAFILFAGKATYNIEYERTSSR
jgi:mannose/cellobiose epimerase-like protein (N-acyl-D-glucosamine 2-epimerase family)